MHSSTSVAQRDPVNPSTHVHANVPPLASAHTAAFWHGCDEHSSMSTAHVGPSNPAAHVHENASTSASQTPPLSQGSERHSSMSTWHVVPPKPATHSHRNMPMAPSVHVALLWQGDSAHSSMSSLHISPVQPDRQVQTNALIARLATQPPAAQGFMPTASHGVLSQTSVLLSEQMPSCWHGPDVHSLTST